MRRARLAALGAPCSLVIAVGAAAQTASTALTGVVQDDAGTMRSAIEVTATNVATGFRYQAATNAKGRYWLTALPPGSYDVSASGLGLETTRYGDVALPIGRTLTLDFTVATTAIEVDGIDVVATRQLIASTESDVAFSVDPDMIRLLPEESRSFIDLAALAPGATVGASTIGTSSFGAPVSVGALNSHSLGVLVDGGDFTEPAFGDVSGGIPLLAIQEFEVVQTSYSAEVGRAASGVLNAVTRRGSNELEMEGFALFRDRRLNSLGHFEEEKPDFDRSHWGLAVGGPIAEDRTHYFVAFERKVENSFVTITTGGAFPDQEGVFGTPFEDNLLFGRLDHRIDDTHEVSLRYSGEIGDKVAQIGTVISGFRVSGESGTEVSTNLHSLLLTHRWSLGEGLLNQARVHFIKRDFSDLPLTDDGSPTLCYPSICTGPFPERSQQNYTRLELIDDLSFVATGGSGTHRIKLGAQVSIQDNEVRFESQNNGLFVFLDDQAPAPAIVFVGGGTFGPTSTNTQFAVFAQDEWNPLPELTLNVGLRYEIETNGTAQGYVSPLAGQLPFIRTTERPIDKNNLAPRLGFAWDPSQDGSTVVRGGFGVFYDALPAHSLGGGLEKSSGEVTSGLVFGPTSLDVEQLRRDNPGAFGELHWPNAAELRTPVTRQFSLGFERALTADMTVRADALLIQGRNIPLERSLNPFDPDTGPRYPGFGELFQMLTEGTADAKMLMTSVQRRFDGGWLRLDYTLADRRNTNDSWNDFVSEPLDPDVTDFSSLEGRAAWDERHRVVATGGAQLPFGLVVSGKLQYSSGRPFTSFIPDDLNGDGFFNDRPAGEPRNGNDGPNFFRTDLGVGWTFPVAQARQIGLQLNVYNVLNRTNFDPASVSGFVGTPLFGKPQVAFRKRHAEVGITIR